MGALKQTVIGNAEWCSFETLKIPAIKARIDSGAKTSSIQATHIRRFKRGGESWVSFEVNPLQDNLSFSIHCESRIKDTRLIKSSSGIAKSVLSSKFPFKWVKKFLKLN